MIEVKFYSTEFIPQQGLTYSVISALYRGKWIFVRHRDRQTWEIAGGHIEKGETPLEAARRELAEETGALEFGIECIATYSVTTGDTTGYGRLYLADVEELGPVPDISEIAEICLSATIPEKNTYPLIQPELFRKSVEHLMRRGGNQKA